MNIKTQHASKWDCKSCGVFVKEAGRCLCRKQPAVQQETRKVQMRFCRMRKNIYLNRYYAE